MNALETAVVAAFEANGNAKEANKAYLEFTKANLIMPVDASQAESDNPIPLFGVDGEEVFVPVFSSDTLFQDWAKDIQDDIILFRLSGVDFLKGIGEDIHVCLNIGAASYKVFNPSEIARMRSIVLKFFRD